MDIFTFQGPVKKIVQNNQNREILVYLFKMIISNVITYFSDHKNMYYDKKKNLNSITVGISKSKCASFDQ